MDPLQEIVDLEEQYHAEGYALGLSDGQAAGRTEGRQFGMEKGFGKFLELGRLNGWSSVLSADSGKTREQQSQDRLQKNLVKLRELTDIENIATENSEEGVADVDERVREAKAKALLLTKMLGQDLKSASSTKQSAELEDFVGLGNRAASTMS